MKKLVVAVDFSEPSLKALELAIELGRQLQGTVHVAYIADMEDCTNSGGEANQDNAIENRILLDFQRKLEVLATRMSEGDTSCTVEVGYGDPCDGIIAVAGRVGADMIIIGTHGRSGIEHLLMGSVAESVLGKTTLPLLCVRAPVQVAGVGTRPGTATPGL